MNNFLTLGDPRALPGRDPDNLSSFGKSQEETGRESKRSVLYEIGRSQTFPGQTEVGVDGLSLSLFSMTYDSTL